MVKKYVMTILEFHRRS